MTDVSTAESPYRVTLKGQGSTDPWLTIEAGTEDAFRDRLVDFLSDTGDIDSDFVSTSGLIAMAAAEYVAALNAQPGISIQRDKPAPTPAAAPAGAKPSTPRPGLSSSLTPEDDGNFWITLPYQKDKLKGGRQRDHAKALGARYKPDDAPASIPRTSKGAPERPWCVHQRFVSEENVQELLRLHETGFADIT